MKYSNAVKYLRERGYRIFPFADGYLTRHCKYIGGISFEISPSTGRVQNIKLNNGTTITTSNSLKRAVEKHLLPQHRVSASLPSLRDTSTV